MATDETNAGGDGAQELVFAFSRHWRSLGFVGLGEDAAGVEGDSIVLVEVAVEDPAIFCTDDIEAVAFAKFGKDSIGEAGLTIFELDDVMLKAG